MPRRAKTGSKGRDGRAPMAGHRSGTGTATNRFTDTFLKTWIAGRLGPSERRLVLALWADGWDEATLAVGTISKPIVANGGDVVRQAGVSALAVWGLGKLAMADAGRIVAAARALRRASGVLPIVHAQLIDVAKTGSPADAAALGALDRIALPTQLQGTIAPGAIIVTDAFKELCGAASHLSLIRDGAPSMSPGRCLYALADGEVPSDGGKGALSRQAQLDALGDFKPMVVAASIIGPEFTLEMLAWLVDTERHRLLRGLAAACAQGVLADEGRRAGGHRYRFQDPTLHARAYDSVPPRQRMRLHCRIAEALRANRRQADASPPEDVARHHRLADDPVQSKRWTGKAAWRAITAEDAPRAIRHLREALAGRDRTGERRAMNCALLHLLGVQLAITEGNGAEAVCQAHRKATRLARRLSPGTSGHTMRALWLAQSCLLVKGDIRRAHQVGRRLLAELRDDTGATGGVLGADILVHRMHALSVMLSGRLQQALQHYDLAIAHYRASRHGLMRFAWGSDQAAVAHAHRAWTHALIGDTNAVACSIRHARQACDRFDHAHTTAHAMSVIAIAALMSDTIDEAFLAAHEARAVALENRFPYWTAWNDIMLAAIDAPASPRTAYAALEVAHARYRATGAAQLSPLVHVFLSDAAQRANHAEQGLAEADAGLALVARGGCVLYRPALLHQRARALIALDSKADAEDALVKGCRAARKSGANVFHAKIERTRRALGEGRQKMYWCASNPMPK